MQTSEANRHAEATDRLRLLPRLAVTVLALVRAAVVAIVGIAFGFGHPEYAVALVGGMAGLVGCVLGGYGYSRYQSEQTAGGSQGAGFTPFQLDPAAMPQQPPTPADPPPPRPARGKGKPKQ